MNRREILRLVPAQAVTEGAGVTVRRTIGTPACRHLDPFLLLDHFSSDKPDDYIAGFPDHPHRGFITLTYMLDGHMEHRDSMGNQGDLRAGGVQWMKAASGIIHSEMPKQTEGLMRGFQLWINLPANHKMDDPAYQELSPEAIPAVHTENTTVRVLSGAYQDRAGPIDDPFTRLQYLDVTLSPDGPFSHEIGPGNAFVYVFEGEVSLGGQTLPSHSLAVLGDGDDVTLRATDNGARFILVTGQPLGEPIVQHGPFVMNSRDEIEQAMRDYRDGRLVQKKAELSGR